MDEKLYTLRDAKKVLAREECNRDGHDLEQNIIRGLDGLVICHAVSCCRCGTSFQEVR